MGTSVLKHGAPKKEHVTADGASTPEAAAKARLFVTATCPNCRIARSQLDAAGVEYEIMDANQNADLARELGIKQAPTLVVADGGESAKYAGVAAVREYISKRTLS